MRNDPSIPWRPRLAMRRLAGRGAGALLLVAGLLTGCAGVSPEDYRNSTPRLQLDEYFNGVVDAWGMFQDRSGKVVRRFTVVLNGKWTGNRGVLEEDFVYDDGEKQRRVWTIVREGNDRYTGTADDVIGQAEGKAAGNALNWHYTLALPVDGKVYHVKLNDWMYLVNERVMINRAVMSKFGIRLGEVLITFRKREVTQ